MKKILGVLIIVLLIIASRMPSEDNVDYTSEAQAQATINIESRN